jgi:hypothetical protein
MSDGVPTKAAFFDIAELPGHTIVDLVGDGPDGAPLIELFGRDLVTRTILMSPALSVFHESAEPHERVQPHRHGTLQIDFVLRGELRFGNRRLTAGMGCVIPDVLYAWEAGDDGAEWIEIHAGQPAIFTDRKQTEA